MRCAVPLIFALAFTASCSEAVSPARSSYAPDAGGYGALATGGEELRWSRGRCAEERRDIEVDIAAAQGCASDDDCLLLELGCPFGCFTALARDSDLSALTARIDRYDARCPACLYQCLAGERRARCGEGRCHVVRKPPEEPR